MKKYFSIFSFLVFVSLFIISCSDSTNNSPAEKWNQNYLHAGYTKIWKMSEYYYDGQQFTIPEWAADNLIIFNYDGTGGTIYGEIDKTEDDTLRCDMGKWKLEGDSIVFTEHFTNDEDGQFTINLLTLTNNTFSYQKNDNGHLTKLVYVPAVNANPNADSLNLKLTHGLTKIWEIDKLKISNQDIDEIPEHYADNYWIFNTDGTGIYSLGEISELEGDKTNNDFFNWIFSEPFGRIFLSNINNITISDDKTIFLTDTLMVLRWWAKYNDSLGYYEAQYKPFLK